MLSVTKITSTCEIEQGRNLGIAWLRLRNRQLVLEHAHLMQEFVCAVGLEGVYSADGKAHVNHDVVAQPGFRNEIQRHLTNDSSELHSRRAQSPLFLDLKNLAWNS